MPKYFTVFESIVRWMMIGILSFLPLFFIPVVQDFYDTNKLVLLVFLALLVSCWWAVRTILHRTIELNVSRLTIALALFTLASVLSTIFASPNKIEALLAPLGPVTFASFTLLSLFGGLLLSEKDISRLRWFLGGGGMLLSLVAIYQFLNLGKILFPGIGFLSDPLWTPIGSPVALLAYQIMLLPILASEFMSSIKHHEEIMLAISVVMIAAIGAGAMLTVVQIVPKLSSLVLSFSDGWSIMLEMLKRPVTAVVGVGAENFLSAFTKGRPLTLNQGSLWNIRFTVSSNFLFHILTTYGLVGGMALISFFWSMFVGQKKSLGLVSLILAAGALMLVPPNLSLLVTIVALLLTFTLPHSSIRYWKLEGDKISLGIGLALVIGIITVGAVYGVGRAYAAELVFYQSILPEARNNGARVYNMQIQAIQLDPAIARFHATYAQTNIALAAAIAANPEGTATQAGQLSDKDKQTITQLIQQAIREGKLAVSYSPQNVIAWENLGTIYQNLLNVAQGADKWAIASYQQAIVLDPTNPSLRQNLGGLYVGQQDYDSAIIQFLSAVQLKPDFANAYYNLANAYKLKGDTKNAIEALNKTLSLVTSGSSDYEKAKNELEDLEKKQSSSTGSVPSISATPTPTPTPFSGKNTATNSGSPQLQLPTQSPSNFGGQGLFNLQKP